MTVKRRKRRQPWLFWHWHSRTYGHDVDKRRVRRSGWKRGIGGEA